MKKMIYSLMLLGLFGLSHSIKTEETENSREMQQQQAYEEALVETQIANSNSSSTKTDDTHSEETSTESAVTGTTSSGSSFTLNDDNIQGQALDDDSTQGGMSIALDPLTTLVQTISNDDAAVQALYNLLVVLQNVFSGQIASNANFVAAVEDLYNKFVAIDMTPVNASQTTSNSNS